MRLHELNSDFKRQSRRRVGRGDGSGHGRTCGRGDKGAGARSGHSHKAYFEGGQIPLFRRLPKRGFKNPNRLEYGVVNIGFLEDAFDTGAVVDEAALRKQGVMHKDVVGVKILGDGELTKSLTVRAGKFSAAARQKIEAAGGVCEEV